MAKKPSKSTSSSLRRKSRANEIRKLSIPFRNHNDLLLGLSHSIQAIGTHLAAPSLASEQTSDAAGKSFLGYDAALDIVLDCSGRDSASDLVLDPQAPSSTQGQTSACILQEIQAKGYSLPGGASISSTDTCDSLAGRIQYATN